MVGHLGLTIDNTFLFGAVNKYYIPDVSLRENKNCRLMSGSLTATYWNIRNGRKAFRWYSLDSSHKVVLTESSTFNPTTLVGNINLAIEQESIQGSFPTLVYDTATNKCFFKADFDFTLIFDQSNGQSCHLGEILGFNYGVDYKSKRYTTDYVLGEIRENATPLAPIFIVEAQQVLNMAPDKAIILQCNTMKERSVYVGSIPNIGNASKQIISEGYMCSFSTVAEDMVLLDLGYPLEYTNIFSNGGVELSLFFASGEPVDLKGGYFRLHFQFF
jgi:hypothetical protein